LLQAGYLVSAGHQLAATQTGWSFAWGSQVLPAAGVLGACSADKISATETTAHGVGARIA